MTPYTPSALARIRAGATAAELGWSQSMYESVCRRNAIPVQTLSQDEIEGPPPVTRPIRRPPPDLPKIRKGTAIHKSVSLLPATDAAIREMALREECKISPILERILLFEIADENPNSELYELRTVIKGRSATLNIMLEQTTFDDLYEIAKRASMTPMAIASLLIERHIRDAAQSS